MNVENYISSGIVESYVLGLADSQERVEFEAMCEAHPEVKAARDAFEAALEQHALQNAVVPPALVRQKLLTDLQLGSDASSPVISMDSTHDQNAPITKIKRLKTFVAAAVILLFLSTALNFYFFGKYDDVSTRYNDLLASQQQLVQQNQSMQTKLQEFSTDMSLIRNPHNVIIKMPASNVQTSPDPNSLATIYWDTQTKDVYLIVNHLPAPSADKQYQLWAMVDGKPVDAGVFDVSAGEAVLKMKNIPSAQAFAVTLEKRGGSPTPDMEQLYILGKV